MINLTNQIIMEKNLKLLSVRINPDTLERIDACAAKHEYWSRNAVINQVLTAVFNHFDEREIWDMLRVHLHRGNPVSAHFKIVDI